jgi:hypothetical protein
MSSHYTMADSFDYMDTVQNRTDNLTDFLRLLYSSII